MAKEATDLDGERAYAECVLMGYEFLRTADGYGAVFDGRSAMALCAMGPRTDWNVPVHRDCRTSEVMARAALRYFMEHIEK